MSGHLTHAQAIRDGVLVDLSRLDATQIHWNCSVVCTAAVWAVISDAVMRHGQSPEALMHELIFKIMRAASKCPSNPVVYFNVEIGGRMCRLKAHWGPGDMSKNVITLMFP
jgi:hypothetical protein